MIAQIEERTQYGKQGLTDINVISESSEVVTAFAHSVQDAVEWLKKYPLYKDATIDNLSDGRVFVTSKWMDAPDIYSFLDGADFEYQRQFVVIFPRNTIYENTGFQGYKAE